MKKILVGVDGSPGAAAAVAFAGELAKASGATVRLAAAIEPAMLYGADATGEVVDLQYAAARDSAARALAEAGESLAKQGVTSSWVQLDGSVADELARVAREDNVDLVVVGHRGRSAIARVLLGSVANRLVEICSRPVLVHR